MTVGDIGAIAAGLGVFGAAVELYAGLPIARAIWRIAARAVRRRGASSWRVLVSDGPVDSPMPPRPLPSRRQRIPMSWGAGTYDDPTRPVYDARADTFYGIPRHALLCAPPREFMATPEGAARWRLALEAMRQADEDSRMDVLLARGRQALRG